MTDLNRALGARHGRCNRSSGFKISGRYEPVTAGRICASPLNAPVVFR